MQKPGTIKIINAIPNLNHIERTDKVCQGANHKNDQMAASVTAHTMDLRFGVAKKLCINILNGAMIVPMFIGRLTPTQL